MSAPKLEPSLRPLPPALLAARGASLREVRADLVRQDTGMRCRWYQGEKGTDCFAWWRLGGALVHVQLSFERRVLDVHDGALRIGELRPDTEGVGYATRFDEWDVLPDGRAREQVRCEALALLAAASGVPEPVRQYLEQALEA